MSATDDPRVVPVLAHELRSPVAAILGYAELLTDGLYGDLDDKAREGVQRVSAAARQLRALIDGLELLLGSGHPDVRHADDVDIGAVVHEVIAAASVEASMRGITLDATVEPVAAVRTDPDVLSRSLQLLLGAALRTAGGPVRVLVTARAREAIVTVPLVLTEGDLSGAHLRRAMADHLIRALGGRLETGPNLVRLVLPAIDAPEANP